MTNKRKIRRFKTMQAKGAKRIEFQKAIDEMEILNQLNRRTRFLMKNFSELGFTGLCVLTHINTGLM